MQQHTVPRDIGSQEFKLVGSMTFRQFLMLLSGIVIAYFFFLLPIHPFLKWPPVITAIFFGFAFAFMPIQERSLGHWIVAFVKAIITPSQRIWRQSGLVPEFLTLKVSSYGRPPLPIAVADRSNLTAFLKTLPESPQTPLESQEEAYLGYLDKSLQHIRATTPRIAPTDRSIEQIARPRTPMPAPGTLASATGPSHTKVIKLLSPDNTLRLIPSVQNVRIRKLHFPGWVTKQEEPRPVVTSHQPSALKPTIFFVPKTSLSPTPAPVPTSAPTLTPESTQKATAIAETELLRTQQVLLGQHIQELEEKLARLREKEQSPTAVAPSAESTRTIQPQVREVEQELSQALAEQVRTQQAGQPSLRKIPKARGREIDVAGLVSLTRAPQLQTQVPVLAKAAAMPALTNLPNAINGVVRSPAGELLASVIIVIKDEQGVPVRALKTNRLGQFMIATPLPSATYTIELEKDGFFFDIMSTTLTGAVLPPIEISARAAQGYA